MYFQLLSLVALVGSISATSLSDSLATSPDLTSLVALLKTLPDTLKALDNAKNITLLASSNDAIAKLLSGPDGDAVQNTPGLLGAVLQYHVLQGLIPASAVTETPVFAPSLLTNSSYTNVTGGQRVEAVKTAGMVTFVSGLQQASSVKQADFVTGDPIVHIIDSVLTLPPTIAKTAAFFNLTSLAGALVATKLLDTVEQAADLTVFAPTNDAFSAASAVIASLGNTTTSSVSALLTYHVVAGTVGYSSLLKDNLKLKSLQGGDLTITLKDNMVFVNGIEVIQANVLVDNGVVHVIKSVLSLPGAAATTSGSLTASGVSSSGTAATLSPSATSTDLPQTVSTAGASPMRTGAVAMGMLFGAGAAVLNY